MCRTQTRAPKIHLRPRQSTWRPLFFRILKMSQRRLAPSSLLTKLHKEGMAAHERPSASLVPFVAVLLQMEAYFHIAKQPHGYFHLFLHGFGVRRCFESLPHSTVLRVRYTRAGSERNIEFVNIERLVGITTRHAVSLGLYIFYIVGSIRILQHLFTRSDRILSQNPFDIFCAQTLMVALDKASVQCRRPNAVE